MNKTIVLLILTGLIAGCSEGGVKPPNIVLISIDTLALGLP